jgi:hypothetical protein
VRYTRHALGRLRFLRLSRSDVASLVWSDSGWISRDQRGNIEVTDTIRGYRVTVVIAADDPGLVVTIIGERGSRP